VLHRFPAWGKSCWEEGHTISDDNIRILGSEGMEKIWVTGLQDGEVSTDAAVSAVAGEMGCGCYEIIWRPAGVPTCTPPKIAAYWWMMNCGARSIARPAW